MKKNISALILTGIFFLSYSVDFFSVGNTSLFMGFQNDSEQLVKNAVTCKVINKAPIYEGMLVSGPASNVCDTSINKPYGSQSGIQGQLMNLFAPSNLSLLSTYYKYWKIILTLFLSTVFAVFVLKIQEEFGVFVSIGLFIFLVLSDWLVYFARNLYWVTFTFFAPFVFSWVFYSLCNNKRKKWLFLLILFFLFLIRFLAGYEYISNVILSSFIPILYFELKTKLQISKLFFLFTEICLVGAISFLVAVNINLNQLSNYYGSYRAGAIFLEHRVLVRSIDSPVSYSDNFFTLLKWSPNLYKSLDKVINIDRYRGTIVEKVLGNINLLFTYLTLPAVSFSFINFPISPLYWMVSVTVLTLGVLFWWKKTGLLNKNRKLFALSVATFSSLIVSNTWVFLGFGHMLNHPHINGIIMYIPFFPMAFIVLTIGIGQITPAFFRQLARFKLNISDK